MAIQASLSPLGQTIRQLRKEVAVTQKELASAVGVTQPTVSNWEYGRSSPNPEEQEKVFDYLGYDREAVLATMQVAIAEALGQEIQYQKRQVIGPGIEQIEEQLEESNLEPPMKYQLRCMIIGLRQDLLRLKQRLLNIGMVIKYLDQQTRQNQGEASIHD